MFDKPTHNEVKLEEIMDFFRYDSPHVVPNFESKPLEEVANTLACGAGFKVTDVVWSRLNPRDSMMWTRLFLNTLQGGGLDGTGYLLRYDGRGHPVAGRFALCQHENKLLPGANPRRGDHRQFCPKCGLNTSYDSSD